MARERSPDLFENALETSEREHFFVGEEKHAAERRDVLRCSGDADEICGLGLARRDREHPEEADAQFLFVLLLLPPGGVRP